MNILPIKGMVRAGQLLIHFNGPILPNQVTVKKLGMMVTMAGIIIVLNKIPKIKSLPGNLILANPYAARILIIKLPTRVIVVIFILLKKYFEKLPRSQASR